MTGKRYNPSTLVWRKDKWYVQVTKPKELQFGTDKQVRRSTGTSDKHEARFLQHRLTQEIYESFDKALMKTDPVFEALRPIFEAEGANSRQWYEEGKLELMVRGEKTATSRAFGVKGMNVDGEGVELVEKWVGKNHVDLLKMATGLGHAITAHVIDLLSKEVRASVMKDAVPQPLSPEQTVRLVGVASKISTEVAKNALRFKSDQPMIKLAEGASEGRKPTLAAVLDDYIASRPEKSRKSDLIQLRKWLTHEQFGRIPLLDVTAYDAYDFLFEFGEDLTKSSIGVLRAAMSNVFLWANKQRKLTVTHNPFKGLDLRNVGQDGTDRRPFTHAQLHKLFRQPMTKDDKAALLILLSTGMRGGELMQMADSYEEDGIHYLDLRNASVKTVQSKRIVPLHDKLAGTSFPLKTTQGKLNRLINETFGDEPVSLHSLRHTFKDLARSAGISEEINNFLTGHKTQGVAGSYGVGPSLKARHAAIMKIGEEIEELLTAISR